MPVLYFQRTTSAQSGAVEFSVVDGQQRLSALFDFMDDRFTLTQSAESSSWYKRRWSTLEEDDAKRFLAYSFVIQELSGYSSDAVREMFNRMNKYVVALNPQERRHASGDGAFKQLVERVGAWEFWLRHGVVSEQGARRMRADELAAELLILIQEGPQDKKQSVDLYYSSYADDFPAGAHLEQLLQQHIDTVEVIVPELSRSFLRRPANFYSLIGALNEIDADGIVLPPPDVARERLMQFQAELSADANPRESVGQYRDAQSRQTDNVRPRRTRIDILKRVILGEA